MNLVPYDDNRQVAETSGGGGQPSPSNIVPFEFTPIPEGFVVNWAVLKQATPKTQRKWLDLGNGKGYFYADTKYTLDTLDEAFGNRPGGWVWVTRRAQINETDDKGQVAVMCTGAIHAPGLPVSGIEGIGMAKYRPQNANDSYAIALASATTRAIKNAAKRLGVAADVNDDPNEANVIEGLQKAIDTLYAGAIKEGHDQEAFKVITRIAPEAIVDGEFDYHAIPERAIDPLKKALITVIAGGS